MDKLEGKNPVYEALSAGREIDRLIIAKGTNHQKIIDLARENGVPIRFVERTELERAAETKAHQGVIAYIAEYSYVSVEDILALAAGRGDPPFVVVLDGVCDPHNLGSIIRTANGAGAHGVIIPQRRGAGLTSTVAKAAAGALEYTPVARVPNIVRALELLKKNGIWIYGTDSEGGRPYLETDFRGGVALVIGNEGEGMGRLVREKCDFFVSIPMMGEIESLNASVAAGIIMYEIQRGRG